MLYLPTRPILILFIARQKRLSNAAKRRRGGKK